jgi:hypothetical protein
MPLVHKVKNGVRWIEVVERETPPADLLDRMFAAWRADVDSVPFPATTSAPEATR